MIMLHEEGLYQITSDMWMYEYMNGANELTLYFRVLPGQVPKTGDMVVENWLITSKDLCND